MQWVTKRYNEVNALRTERARVTTEAEKLWEDLWAAINLATNTFNRIPGNESAFSSGKRFESGSVEIEGTDRHVAITLDREASTIVGQYKATSVAARTLTIMMRNGLVVMVCRDRTLSAEEASEVLLLPVLFPALVEKG